MSYEVMLFSWANVTVLVATMVFVIAQDSGESKDLTLISLDMFVILVGQYC